MAKWISLKPEMDDYWGDCIQTLEGHWLWTEAVAYAPDSSLIASGSADHSVRIWSSTGECKHTLDHGGWVHAVAFSHDSALIASADGREMRVWSIDTGECLQVLKGIEKPSCSVAFSQDSTRVGTSCQGGGVRIWHRDDPNHVQTMEPDGDEAILSPDLTLVAATLNEIIRIRSIDTGELVCALKHERNICRVAFSSDSRLLASTSHDLAMRIWRVDTGMCIQTLLHDTSLIHSVAFSNDSKLVASVADGTTVVVWDIHEGKLLQTLVGHSDQITAMAFSPDSAQIASASYDRTIRIWNIDAGREHFRAGQLHGRVGSLVLSPDSKFVAVVCAVGLYALLRIWRLGTPKLLHTLKVEEFINSVVFSHSSALVMAGLDDGSIRILSTKTGQCLQSLDGHGNDIMNAVFSHDSELVASASMDKTAGIWCTSTGKCLHILQGHSDCVSSVAFSHKSDLVASASDDNTVRIWRTSTGECLKILEGHVRRAGSVVFSSDSVLLASTSEDGTVKIWRVDSGDCMHTLRHNGRVSGSISASSTADVPTEYCASPEEDSDSVPPALHPAAAHEDGLSPDHGTLSVKAPRSRTDTQSVSSSTSECNPTPALSESGEETTGVEAVDTLECPTIASYDSTPVAALSVDEFAEAACLVFSHDSALLAASSYDMVVRIWRIETGECIQTTPVGRIATCVAFSPGGSRVMTDLGAIAVLGGDHQVGAALGVERPGVGIRDEWITWSGGKLLWLPADFRSQYSAVANSTVVIGSPAGKLIFISLSADCLDMEESCVSEKEAAA